jgi:hypothetical protein
MSGAQANRAIKGWRRAGAGFVFLIATFLAWPVHAQETTCARVKIEIKQELTLERQAFDAQM